MKIEQQIGISVSRSLARQIVKELEHADLTELAMEATSLIARMDAAERQLRYEERP